MTFDVITDRQQWIDCWQRTAAREPHGHPDYCGLFADPGISARCAVGADGENGAMFPFLLRELSAEPWAAPGEKRADVAVPPGYGGAYLLDDADPATPGTAFWAGFEDWATGNDVVCADARISLYREEILPLAGWTETPACDNVVIDLDQFRELDIDSFGKSARRDVRYAAKRGVTVAPEHGAEAFEVFHKLYLGTMDRLHASDFYYFSPEFFTRLESFVGTDLGTLFVGRDDEGEPLCAGIVLLGARRGYDFLVGANDEARRLKAHHYLRYAICGWLAERGLEEFILGGGNRPDDHLFAHKLRFAADGRRPYSVGSRTYDQPGYDELVATRQEYQQAAGLEPHVARRFPNYR